MGTQDALLRIKGAIDNTLKTVQVGEMSGAALGNAYETYRVAVENALPADEMAAEFERLYQPIQPMQMPASAAGFDPRKSAGKANEAAAGLAGISGWIAGSERALQAAAEAKAYAEARLRQEGRA